MTVTALWELTPRGTSTVICVSGQVDFSGFFIGKDKARRQSIEGIANSCKKMEEKLCKELNLDEGGDSNNPTQVQHSSQNLMKIASSVEEIERDLISIVAGSREIRSKGVFFLGISALVLQVLLVLILYFKLVSSRYLFATDEL